VTFDALWADLQAVGRARSGGYRRFAWTPVDLAMREWFTATAAARGLDVLVDRAGNQWAWWGDPDGSGPGLATGSHLDSVPDGGAFDGPLGVIAGFAAVDVLRDNGFTPARPIAVVNFVDEEGARFGAPCVGSRLITGALTAKQALALRDGAGTTMADALRAAGQRPDDIGRDDAALRRIGVFVEVHIEQGRGLVRFGAPVGVASGIWPHGRWRVDFTGEANHAGTTALDDRHDPMLDYAHLVLAARASAAQHGGLATCGKVTVQPNGVNAIPSRVTAWVDVRAPQTGAVHRVVEDLSVLTKEAGGLLQQESWTDAICFDLTLREQLAVAVGGAPALATGAGHDAGILASAGIPSGMIFVRNPTGVSHSPAEFAERDDCLAAVAALLAAVQRLAG
jgi:N-carbamoyl-L-amino-acid hydrolase